MSKRVTKKHTVTTVARGFVDFIISGDDGQHPKEKAQALISGLKVLAKGPLAAIAAYRNAQDPEGNFSDEEVENTGSPPFPELTGNAKRDAKAIAAWFVANPDAYGQTENTEDNDADGLANADALAMMAALFGPDMYDGDTADNDGDDI